MIRPLSRDLAGSTSVCGRGAFRSLIFAAIAVRLALLPLAHTWDGTTYANAFVELAQPGTLLDSIRRPYDTTRELSLLTQGTGRHRDYYEYWAYPPGMLLLWWPLAKLSSLLLAHFETTFVAQPAFISTPVPFLLQIPVRLPILLADIASLFLLRALGVSVRGIRWYAFNPLVLLAGVWTFDAVMVAFLMCGLLLAQRGHWAASGVALALGAVTKFVPLVVVPAVCLAALNTCATDRQRLHAVARLLCAAAATVAVLTWPVADGIQYILDFHWTRFAAGLTLQAAWLALAPPIPSADWQPPWQAYASVETGALVLPLVMLASLFLVAWRRPPLLAACLVLLLAFLVGSKLVNEPYTLAIVAVATVEVARRPSVGLVLFRDLAWALPFGYAILNVPIWSLLVSATQQVVPASASAIADWMDGYRAFFGSPAALLPSALLGGGFTLTAMLSIWLVSRPAQGQNAGDVAVRSKFPRWIIVGLAAAVVFWSGYAVGRVQDIVDISRLYKDVDVDRYSLMRNGVVVHFERLGGAGKPFLRTADGAELLDVSDWDRDSVIHVDGSVTELTRLYPTSSVDYGLAHIVETLHGSGWLLEREIGLEADGTMWVEHTFIARRPIRRVDLTVAHVHTSFENPSVSGEAVAADIANTAQASADRDVYHLSITSVGDGAVPRFRVGRGGALGPVSILADFSADTPQIDRRVPLGREVVRVQRLH